MNIRGTFTVAGIVQNVNYRETVHRIMLGAGLKGFVRNQDDGSVRVVAEGDRKTVRTLPARLEIRSDRISVENVIARYSKATGEFRSFVIDYGPDVAPGDLALIEKIDEGYHIMLEMSERLDLTNRSIGSVDSHVKSMDTNIGGHFNKLERKQDATTAAVKAVSSGLKAVDSTVKSMDSNIKAMDSNIGGHFRRLDAKYDRFGKTLSNAAGDIHGMKRDIGHVRSDIHGVRADIRQARLAGPKRRKKARAA